MTTNYLSSINTPSVLGFVLIDDGFIDPGRSSSRISMCASTRDCSLCHYVQTSSTASWPGHNNMTIS
jgi:hypothetical protein